MIARGSLVRSGPSRGWSAGAAGAYRYAAQVPAGLTRLTPRRTESPWLLGTGLVIALLGVVLDQWDGPSWLLLLVALALAIVTAVREVAARRAEHSDQENFAFATAAKQAGGGGFPVIDDLDRESFGVHRSAIQMGFQPRDIETPVKEAIQERRPVLLVGASMTGKTRLLHHVLKESYGQWRVWIPAREGVAALFEGGRSPSEIVLWLDDLEGHLSGDQPLRADWIDRAVSQGCIVVATIRAEEYLTF